MAVYGFGARFGNETDVSRDFLLLNGAFIGYDRTQSPSLHEMLKSIRINDLVFIKSFTPQKGLFVKSAGRVTGLDFRHSFPLDAFVQPEGTLSGASPLSHDLRLSDTAPVPSVSVECHGVRVDWLWNGLDRPHHVGTMRDKMDFMRRGTLYQEFHPELVGLVAQMVAGRFTPS